MHYMAKMNVNALTPFVSDALCLLALHHGSQIALRVCFYSALVDTTDIGSSGTSPLRSSSRARSRLLLLQ